MIFVWQINRHLISSLMMVYLALPFDHCPAVFPQIRGLRIIRDKAITKVSLSSYFLNALCLWIAVSDMQFFSLQVWEEEGHFHLSCGPVCLSPASVLLSFMEDVLHHVPLCWSLPDFHLYFCLCTRYEL